MKFDFISDENFRIILERDYDELLKCIDSKSSKSVLILSGSIIEAVMLDYFLSFPPEGYEQKKLLKLQLFDLINLAKDTSLISQTTKDLSSVIKNYRNLIHPGREIRTGESFDFDTALVAKSLLNIVLKEISENYFNSLGYSATDIVSKLQNDSLPQSIFEIILTKVQKPEKAKLFEILVDIELGNRPFDNEIKNPIKYINILKTQIDRTTIETQLSRLINKIETGAQREVIKYYEIFHSDINFLKQEEIDLIILYLINAFADLANEQDYITAFNSLNLFSSFGTYLLTETIKVEFLNLVCKIVKNYEIQEYEYFTAYDQLINSVPGGYKSQIIDYVVKNVSKYTSDSFYKGYNSGKFLPF